MNERNEIAGDLRDEYESVQAEDAVCESWYLDWCYRMGMAPSMGYQGQGTAPDGEPVNVWGFQ